MMIKTFNEYYNKRGAYMGEKNPENDKKAARFGWILKTTTATFLNPAEGFAEEAALREIDRAAAQYENANTIR